MANKNIIFLLLLLILAISCFSAYKVVKHYDLYANDPLVYGAKNYNIDSCFCYTNEPGTTVSFNQEAVTIKKDNANNPTNSLG